MEAIILTLTQFWIATEPSVEWMEYFQTLISIDLFSLLSVNLSWERSLRQFRCLNYSLELGVIYLPKWPPPKAREASLHCSLLNCWWGRWMHLWWLCRTSIEYIYIIKKKKVNIHFIYNLFREDLICMSSDRNL